MYVKKKLKSLEKGKHENIKKYQKTLPVSKDYVLLKKETFTQINKNKKKKQKSNFEKYPVKRKSDKNW